MVWPRDDAQLDTWLASQELSSDDEAWLKEVILRRLQGARSPAGADLGPAADEADLVEQVVVAAKSSPGPLAPTPIAQRQRQLSYDDLALLNGQLLELVEAGVALPTGLAAYARDVEGGRLEQVLGQLRRDLEEGRSLSEAVERQGSAFPPLYKSLVAAGEAGGDLRACLALLHEQAEVDAELDRRIQEALSYPTLAFAGAVAGMLVIAFLIGPTYQELWVGYDLPFVTDVVLDTAAFLREYAVLTVVAALGAVVAVWTYGPRLLPRAVRFTSGWWTPSRSLGELARALAGFLHRGLPLPQAVAALESADLRLPAGTLQRLRERVEAGEGLAASMREESVFPASFVWIVGAAERRGDLPNTLHDLALRQEREFQRRVRMLEVLVGPLVLAITGILVSFGALSIYLPLFELQRALQQ
jgi:type II secretory pathway component PulF